MKNKVTRFALIGALTIAAPNVLAAGEAPTMSNMMQLQPSAGNQIELDQFELQMGTSLSFSGNPLFTDQVSAGSLPIVANRLPEEPLVILPMDEIGTYGGVLRGASLALESGTSEILSWRQVNLVRLNPVDNTIVPNVAKSWEWNEDKTEITFTLRKGHKWSDGDPFDADDVGFWVNDIMRNETLTPAVWGNWAFGGETVAFEKIDDETFKFIFAAPNPIFLHYLATSGSYFTPWAASHVLKQYHIKYNPNADAEAIDAGFDNWRAKYGGMDTSMMSRLKELEAENSRLKKMYADVQLQNDVIKEAMAKKW